MQIKDGKEYFPCQMASRIDIPPDTVTKVSITYRSVKGKSKPSVKMQNNFSSSLQYPLLRLRRETYSHLYHQLFEKARTDKEEYKHFSRCKGAKANTALQSGQL